MLLFQTSLSAGIAKKQEDINQPTAQQQKAAEIHFNAVEKAISEIKGTRNEEANARIMEARKELEIMKRTGATVNDIIGFTKKYEIESQYKIKLNLNQTVEYILEAINNSDIVGKERLTDEYKKVNSFDQLNALNQRYEQLFRQHGIWDQIQRIYTEGLAEHERIKAQATTPKAPKGGGPQKTQVAQNEGEKRDKREREEEKKAKGKIPKTTTPGEEQAEERRKHYAEEPHSPNTEFFKPVA